MLDSDIEIVNRIKSNEDIENNLEELVSRHSGIYCNIVNQYLSGTNNTLRNDMLEDKKYRIYEAAMKYDPNRNMKVSTFIGNMAYWACLSARTENEHTIQAGEDEYAFDRFKAPEEIDNREEVKRMAAKVIEIADSFKDDERVSKLFRMRYLDENAKFDRPTSWKYIAREIGLTTQGTIYLHDRYLKKIKSRLIDEKTLSCISSD